MFNDRTDAGRQLASKLKTRVADGSAIVLALPRGGVPVAFEVARAIGAPLDVLVVRKVGVPGREELAIGAIASGGVLVVNREIMDQLGATEDQVAALAEREKDELDRRERLYRGDRPFPSLAGKTVVLVDDGLATGSTMQAAVQAVRRMNPARIVVAVPVGAADTCERLRGIADEVVCVREPDPFFAVGNWYDNFEQTTDEEVRELLEVVKSEPRPRP